MFVEKIIFEVFVRNINFQMFVWERNVSLLSPCLPKSLSLCPLVSFNIDCRLQGGVTPANKFKFICVLTKPGFFCCQNLT